MLIDILVIGILAVICHAETWEEMEDFASAREDWLRQFLQLPGGVPSHDTIARVFSLIDPRELEVAFIKWVRRAQAKRSNGDTVCIDGKSLKGTVESNLGQGRRCLHVVNAFSTAQGIVLGQVKASGRGNAEVSAALELLDMIDIEKTVILADAGIGRVGVANKIIEKKGDYIFPIKSNSGGYYDAIRARFENEDANDLEGCQIAERGHGRSEVRTLSIIRCSDFNEEMNLNRFGEEHFAQLNAIGRITYEREVKETAPFIYVDGKRAITTSPTRIETETLYFITSLKCSAKEMAVRLRHQWAIENQLHWCLDVSLGEDSNRTRNKIAAQNLAVARKIALNLVKQDKSRRIGLKSRLKRAGWDLQYLEALLMKAVFDS